MKDDKKVRITLGTLEFMKSRIAQLENENDLLITELAQTTQDAAKLYKELYRLTATVDAIKKLMSGNEAEKTERGASL